MNISEAQQAFFRSGGFRGGVDRPEPSELSALEQMLSEYITRFLNKASDNLEQSNSITTGNLNKSLSFDVIPNNNGYLINFTALDYYKFVDKGVRGSGGSRKNNTSPYSFRDKMPPPTLIEKWIIRNRLVARVNDITRYGATRREKKAINPALAQKSLAFLIARSIKNNGITATNFWTKAFDETFSDFGQKLSTSIGKTITVNLEQMKEDLANFKGKGGGRGVNIPRI